MKACPNALAVMRYSLNEKKNGNWNDGGRQGKKKEGEIDRMKIISDVFEVRWYYLDVITQTGNP